MTRWGRLCVAALVAGAIGLATPAMITGAGATYPADAWDAVPPGDDNPNVATNITTQLRNTGAGAAAFTTSRTFTKATAAGALSEHDPDWFKFDVSAQEVVWEYAYYFEAISFTDPLVDPVIEIYGPDSAPPSFSYGYGHAFAPQSWDTGNAIDGNIYGPWFSDRWQEPSGHGGACLEFRPVAAGTYWIRVRPYGDTTGGGTYWEQAGPYVFRGKIGMASRVAGSNREDTAVQISRERFADDQLDGTASWSNLSAAIVVNGYTFPDALAASSLAGVVQGPILLCEQGDLPSETANELQRLDPDTVYVIGGTTAVANTVVGQIEALFPPANPVVVERIAGSDRVETSVDVAAKSLGLTSLTPITPPGFAIIANAYSFPDALSASSMAAANTVPIFLTNGTTLDGRIKQALTDYSITDVIIVGGPAAISSGIESYLTGRFGATRVVRLSGDDRYETSKEFAAWASAYPGGGVTVGTPGNSTALRAADPRRIGLATGENFPDALAAGPFCGDTWLDRPSPLLLTEGDRLSKWVVDAYGGQLGPGETSYFDDIWSMGGVPKVNRSYLFGGSAVLQDAVWWALDSQS